MKITAHRSCGPVLELELLLRFVMRKCAEVIEHNRTELPAIWVALALSAVAHDEDFHTRLKEVVSTSSDTAEKVLGMYQNVFMPALGRLQDGHMPEYSDDNSSPEERTCRAVLLYALREGKKMLASGDYEFIRVFESLGWMGLQYNAFRLYQFEAVRHSCESDPESLVQRGVEIIRAAVGISPRKEK